MSYRLNKTNGDLVVELADGEIDNTSTDVTLVGRNYRGFGELFNENFIKIVENFASTSAPDNPLQGQLWYDTSQERLKIYNGTAFRTAGAPIVSPSQPSLVRGDLWIDNQNKKLYFFDGNEDGEITLVGPAYDDAQGKSGLEVESVIDIGSQERVVIKVLLANELFAVITKESFRLSGNNKIAGYPDDPNDVVNPPRQLFKQGFNLADPDYFYQGTADSARSLIDSAGNTRSPADFLPSDADSTTIGSLTIKNSNGLSVGIGDTIYSQYKVIGTTTAIETQQSETDIALRTRIGNSFTTPVYVNSSESKIGIYNTDPNYTLDITGNVRTTGDTVIEGDLTVNGNATYINVDTLRVLDKNIMLGLLDDSTQGNDADVDGAGMTVSSSNGSKDFIWVQSTNSWTSNVNIDLSLGNEYKINGNTVLSRTKLGPLVTKSSLTQVGLLEKLDVDGITLDNNTIESNDALTFNVSGGVISVSNSKIKNLSDPVDNSDATTKSYVDDLIRSQPVALSIDTSSLDDPSENDPYNDVADILERLSPATDKEEGVIARIHTTAYNKTEVTNIDVQSAMNKSFVPVDGESVVQDVNFDSTSGEFEGEPTRLIMEFEVENSQWKYLRTNSYP